MKNPMEIIPRSSSEEGNNTNAESQQNDIQKWKDKNFYQRLGVSKDATTEEIIKAFKKASLQYHPDKIIDETESNVSEEIQKLLGEAKNTLSNENSRKRYDMELIIESEENLENKVKPFEKYVDRKFRFVYDLYSPSGRADPEDFRKSQIELFQEIRRQMDELINNGVSKEFLFRKNGELYRDVPYYADNVYRTIGLSEGLPKIAKELEIIGMLELFKEVRTSEKKSSDSADEKLSKDNFFEREVCWPILNLENPNLIEDYKKDLDALLAFGVTQEQIHSAFKDNQYEVLSSLGKYLNKAENDPFIRKQIDEVIPLLIDMGIEREKIDAIVTKYNDPAFDLFAMVHNKL